MAEQQNRAKRHPYHHKGPRPTPKHPPPETRSPPDPRTRTTSKQPKVLRHGGGEPTVKKNIDLDQQSEYAEKPQHPPHRDPPTTTQHHSAPPRNEARTEKEKRVTDRKELESNSPKRVKGWRGGEASSHHHPPSLHRSKRSLDLKGK
jgi:hypothetical protein